VAGALAGAGLLLALPAGVFRHVVPVLLLVACGLVAVQPHLAARRGRRAYGESAHQAVGDSPDTRRATRDEARSPALLASVFASGVYGGYFGAAQSVILVSLLGIFVDDHLQRLNAAKNVLALLVNAAAAVVFVAVSHVAWQAAGLIAIGSALGGQLGGAVGRRLPTPLLRLVIIAVGVSAAVALLA
jgi:hypothetical protein